MAEYNPNELRGLVASYKRLFDTEDGKKIMQDLEKFCRYNATTRGNSPSDTEYNEGKRVVVLRIKNFVNITEETLTKLGEEHGRSTDNY